MNDAIDTINAAATAIVSAENRQQQQSSSSSSSLQKRQWGSFWGISSCFGSQKQSKKIGHAVLVPEPSSSRTEGQTIEFHTQKSSVVLPFIAPPSSPASFLQSEPPYAIQSPSGLISFTAATSGMYSPSDPTNMFAVGPYAHETQLVSPPMFSTYTTELSTAPFTPPPESVQLTTPSSPEVPFARFLGSASQNGDVDRKFLSPHHEFQLYQLYPGSPRGQLISPGSGVTNSGTSSPYGDIPRGYAPFLLNSTGANLWPPGWKSLQDSGATTPDPTRTGSALDRQNSDVGPLTSFSNDDQHMVNHRVSFEITQEEVVRCVGSPVLGYLTAGILIGPYGLSIISNVHAAKAIAEFGVVFLLFNIGLELSVERLSSMKKYVFGLGYAQVLTALVWHTRTSKQQKRNLHDGMGLD